MARSRYAKACKRAPASATPQTEIDFALILEARKRAGEILDYRHHGLTLLLADPSDDTKGVRYTPDFFVMASDHVVECYECKGPRTEEDAWIKLKIAASQWPFRFFLCVRAKSNGPWTIRQV